MSTETHTVNPLASLTAHEFRARLDARRDNLDNAADRAAANADSHYRAAFEATAGIPLGQPILVGDAAPDIDGMRALLKRRIAIDAGQITRWARVIAAEILRAENGGDTLNCPFCGCAVSLHDIEVEAIAAGDSWQEFRPWCSPSHRRADAN